MSLTRRFVGFAVIGQLKGEWGFSRDTLSARTQAVAQAVEPPSKLAAEQNVDERVQNEVECDANVCYSEESSILVCWIVKSNGNRDLRGKKVRKLVNKSRKKRQCWSSIGGVFEYEPSGWSSEQRKFAQRFLLRFKNQLSGLGWTGLMGSVNPNRRGRDGIFLKRF